MAILVSRNAAVTQEQLEELAANDAAVFTVSCDATDEAMLGSMAKWARESLPPIEVYSYDCGSARSAGSGVNSKASYLPK